MPSGSFKEEVKERFMQAVERVKKPKKVHKGITACPEDQHIHVQVLVAFFKSLIIDILLKAMAKNVL